MEQSTSLDFSALLQDFIPKVRKFYSEGESLTSEQFSTKHQEIDQLTESNLVDSFKAHYFLIVNPEDQGFVAKSAMATLSSIIAKKSELITADLISAVVSDISERVSQGGPESSLRNIFLNLQMNYQEVVTNTFILLSIERAIGDTDHPIEHLCKKASFFLPIIETLGNHPGTYEAMATECMEHLAPVLNQALSLCSTVSNDLDPLLVITIIKTIFVKVTEMGDDESEGEGDEDIQDENVKEALKSLSSIVCNIGEVLSAHRSKEDLLNNIGEEITEIFSSNHFVSESKEEFF